MVDPSIKKHRLSSKTIFWMAVVFFAGLAAAFVLYRYYPAAQKYFPKCPSYELLGIYCSGCGNTRAAYYLLHGDFAGVFRSNLFFLPTILFAVLLFFRFKFISRLKLVYLFLLLALIFTVLRNLPWYPFTLLAPVPLS